MYLKFFASTALQFALYHSVSQFQPWMWIILTRTQLVLLSISNVQEQCCPCQGVW